MSNTVITNYTDLNGPSTKADSSVVVIVNKDGSLSVDQKLLGTLMGTDGSQGAGISVVRVGHEGRPDDATDSETEDDKIPHVTLTVDSYYDEPNSIIKYDSGAEMLQSLMIETRENSLIGFQNDHCYTPLTSPSQNLPQRSDSFPGYDESVIEISHTPPPKPVPSSKKITILEQKIIPKGNKIVINTSEPPVILKGNDVLNKPLPVLLKSKEVAKSNDAVSKTEDNNESSSISSSGDSIPDRDSDSDYKDTKDRVVSVKVKKTGLKPRILKNVQQTKVSKLEPKVVSRLKLNKNVIKKDIKERIQQKNVVVEKKQAEVDLETLLPTTKISVNTITTDSGKSILKPTPKPVKKEKKTPAHVTALLSDMTSLFSTPDVIRRVSTDNKTPTKVEKEPVITDKKPAASKPDLPQESKELDTTKLENLDKVKTVMLPKMFVKHKNTGDKLKGYELNLIPHIDDASLASILQDTPSIAAAPVKTQPNATASISSPGLAGPLSPTLDLLGGIQPEEEGLTEDLLMHVAQLVESSENLQEVIDKQVLGKVDTASSKTPVTPIHQTAAQSSNSLYAQTLSKSIKNAVPRKDPIEIVRRDGRVITLPPIEAPATRASKRKSQMETTHVEPSPVIPSSPIPPTSTTPEPSVGPVSKQYVNKKLIAKKPEEVVQSPVTDKITAESQESWNSEDDPNRLWCICKQPHNNRFMICCDGCEDWFHGKCVNITKAMGQQMEEQGIEWRCPNCTKATKTPSKSSNKLGTAAPRKSSGDEGVKPLLSPVAKESTSKTNCIVCKKLARASSIYCGDACILKHAQDSLNQNTSTKTDSEPGKSQEKSKSESRVIVYERKSGRLLAGPNAPTADNLKAWLQKNPTFEVVRPGALSTIKPTASKKKSTNEPNRIQTTLNFERIPRKTVEQTTPVRGHQPEPGPIKERMIKLLPSPREESRMISQPKTPVTPKSQQPQLIETPKVNTSAKSMSEPRKALRGANRQSLSAYDKAPSVSPSTSRRKDSTDNKSKKMDSTEPIRDNVRKSLQEQMSIRMAEHDGPKFTDDEIQEFAFETESELHELFKDVGIKYKAKYRSLMFNIKDRKNLSLWLKICEGEITPKQLVRLSPEELASQELAQWRDKEAKHQLELIKKSELDLLAASKTYVLKTHKGEEVMENKTSVSTELDPNVPVEDVVIALNDSTVGEEVTKEVIGDSINKTNKEKKNDSKKREKEPSKSDYSKRAKKESKRDSKSRSSRSSRRKSEINEKASKEERRSTRRSDKKLARSRSVSKERVKSDSKEKSDSSEHSRHRSRSRAKSKRRSKSREHSRSISQERERSRSRMRTRRRSHSRDSSKRRRKSRSKQRSSTEETKHRSKSQDAYSKSKNDSPDSESVERPKSAMMKEIHPEYDPHEPMITSAFSEEDLKSREDSYEDSYNNLDYTTDYDAAKVFSIENNIMMPSTPPRHDKISETESDQEPSSTVDNSAATVWNGCINMVDVARFYVHAYEVSGSAVDLEDDINTELDIVGRINPETVWDYIVKTKKASNKDIVILKLQAANDEEKMQYIALYSYLSSRNRLGVVKVSSTSTVKDLYIVPVPANSALPGVLLPLHGPGLGDTRTHLLIGIVIRQRKKRLAPHIPKDIIPAKVARESRKRSYTPPALAGGSYTPPRRTLPLPAYTSPALSTSVKDKIAASLAAADDEEAYSPGSSVSSGASAASAPHVFNKMEELNRQIEEQKQQILKMAQADSSMADDEAYSPSRPMTPPLVGAVPLADIALPSNLQEILATIKQRSETAPSPALTDIDMRNLPLP